MGHRLASKVAVITGAASGIGLATTELFLAEGASVIAADVQDDVGRVLEQRHGDRLRFVHCDVTRLDELRTAIDAAATHFGGLDILFSNAGRGGTPAGLHNWDPEGWDATHHLLLRAVAAGAAYALPHMRARGGGAIVNTASVSGLQAGYAPMAYSVAKAAVVHFTRVAAAELSQHRIRINAIAPGFIPTNIFGPMLGMDAQPTKELAERFALESGRANPIGRSGAPSDIAQAVLYLASDAATFVTGTCLTVDGGLTIGPRHSWDPEAPSPMSQVLGMSRREVEALRTGAGRSA